MKNTQQYLICCLAAMILTSLCPLSYAGTVRIYIDADRTGSRGSGISIEQGIKTALSEVDYKLAGVKAEIIIKDHRGNTRRSKKHLDEYLDDDQALVVFCGLHSPPLLAHREFINKRGILLLDPWAAAGPITRYPSDTNSIFRLSIDDTKAGYVIVDYAVVKDGYKKIGLLLEATGWGKSNDHTMTRALGNLGMIPAIRKWFNWNLNENGARIILREIINAGADSLLLVANATEGKIFARAMASFPKLDRIPIYSHWGITGGDFPEEINLDIRKKIDLHFIQTSFSFVSDPRNAFGRKVFLTAQKLFPESIKTVKDIKAPTGFVHAYDLTKLLIAACRKAGLTGDISRDRMAVRDALENINVPVRGLIKTYIKPFSVFDGDNPDAHEALSIEDYVMAHYGNDGEIILESNRKGL